MSAELGQPGQIIDGKYRIVRLLGTGGMGAVFEGENIRIRRKVAIKMLHGSVSTNPEVVARFEREAQAAALVGSDHICEVLDLGMLPDQTRYMVMEYLEGDTLSGLIKRAGRLTPAQSIPILGQILDALGSAHAAGIIHRDLKPDNVFILPQKGGVQNFVKILDFGVSKFSQLGGEEMNVTRAGAVVGTPYYMSPEQARGSSAIDNRTDIYAIGVLLYQATTGQVPYQAETFNELLFKIVLEVAPPPQTYVPDLDPEFANIIQCAMAREPAQRFQSCQQFKDALFRFKEARTPRPGALPAYNLPSFHNDEPPPLRTEVLDLKQLPPLPGVSSSGASWPVVPGGAPGPPGVAPPAPADGTMPMGPGLVPVGRGGPANMGSTPNPAVPFQQGTVVTQSGANWGAPPVAPAAPVAQSGANWGAASSPGPAPMATSSTANSWGNASSAANAVPKPAMAKGWIFVAVGSAAILGIGAAVFAVLMMGKGHGGVAPAAASGPGSASPSVTSVAAAPPSAVPSATAAPAATASATAAAPSSTADAAAADTSKAAVKQAGPTGTPVGTKGTKPPVTKQTVVKSKPGGDLGY